MSFLDEKNVGAAYKSETYLTIKESHFCICHDYDIWGVQSYIKKRKEKADYSKNLVYNMFDLIQKEI